MNNTERKIIERLIDVALEEGYFISVNDGEDFVLERSEDKAAILDVMASTEEDYLHFHLPSGNRFGWVRLIYGNDEDVISDNSDNRLTNGLLDA